MNLLELYQDRLNRMKEIRSLSLELSDNIAVLLTNLLTFCKEYKIPLHKDRTTWNLVNRIEFLLKEIEDINSGKPLPKFEFEKINRKLTGDDDNPEVNSTIKNKPYIIERYFESFFRSIVKCS